jgi:uncharacterized protein YndB with AHSA1/START domain
MHFILLFFTFLFAVWFEIFLSIIKMKRMSQQDPSLVSVQLLTPASTDYVWRSLVNIDLMKEWFFALEEFQPVTGFEFSFKGQAEDRSYIHHCRIIEVIPGKKIAYTWTYEGYTGESIVSFHLEPEESGSILVLTHEGLDNFSPLNPDFDIENFREGWTQIIGTSLKRHLEG